MSLRAAILNGGPAQGFPDRVAGELAALLRARGSEVQTFVLRDLEIADCTGCFGCWVRTPGECVLADAGREVAREVIRSDLVALVTPVTFGGYASGLKKAVDRFIPLGSPFFTRIEGETHHRRRYDRYPRLLGVGTVPRADGDAEAIFRQLVGRNALNLHCPAHTAGVLVEGADPAAALTALLGRLAVPA
ncbi:MAG: flavodoxin family protein [Deferrisomatales bacterium]